MCVHAWGSVSGCVHVSGVCMCIRGVSGVSVHAFEVHQWCVSISQGVCICVGECVRAPQGCVYVHQRCVM